MRCRGVELPVVSFLLWGQGSVCCQYSGEGGFDLSFVSCEDVREKRIEKIGQERGGERGWGKKRVKITGWILMDFLPFHA